MRTFEVGEYFRLGDLASVKGRKSGGPQAYVRNLDLLGLGNLVILVTRLQP